MTDLTDSPEDRAFREEARAWLTEQLEGPFAHVRFRGGPGEEDEEFEGRVEWEKAMGAAGWTGIGYGVAYQKAGDGDAVLIAIEK